VPYHTENGSSLEAFSGPCNSPLSFSQQLLDRRNDRAQSRFMAVAYNSSLLDVWLFTNLSAPRSLPILQNLIANTQLRNLTRNLALKITTSLRPFDFSVRERLVVENVNGIFSAITVALAMCFVPGSYAVFLVKERESKSKHLQFISGVGLVPYWASNFVWDIICFVGVASVMTGIIFAFGNSNFVGDNFGVIWVDFILFGLSVIPFTYCCSFLFSSHTTSQNVMIMIYLIGGLGMTILSMVLFQFASTRDFNNDYLRFLFRLHPSFCVADTVFFLSLRTFLGRSQWDLTISGYNFIFMSVETVVYSILAIAIEVYSSRADLIAAVEGSYSPNPVSARLASVDSTDDEDVSAERARLQQVSDSNDQPLISLRGLRKIYGNGKVAVRDLWFGVPKNQCFGFLGVNGMVALIFLGLICVYKLFFTFISRTVLSRCGQKFSTENSNRRRDSEFGHCGIVWSRYPN
jgi:ATP-binding cassette subfamily A (ABC1) protein 3